MANIPYITTPAQEYALESAIRLRQPLLLTGEPGTGKTQMAYWAVRRLNEQFPGKYHPELLRFNTKTISKASDLFYSYDALSHFQAANLQSKNDIAPTARFIELQALGKAIAYSNPKAEYTQFCRVELPEKPCSTVILIDEVDKAPRDFTNDLLNEIENYRFEIREQDSYTLQGAPDQNIVIILTSNSEKNLPDAFLRRCAFFHIEFPDAAKLREIVTAHLGNIITPDTETVYNDLFAFFEKLRDKAVRKKPATAELISWLRLLSLHNFAAERDPRRRRELLTQNLAFLVKTKDDLEVARTLIDVF